MSDNCTNYTQQDVQYYFKHPSFPKTYLWQYLLPRGNSQEDIKSTMTAKDRLLLGCLPNNNNLAGRAKTPGSSSSNDVLFLRDLYITMRDWRVGTKWDKPRIPSESEFIDYLIHSKTGRYDVGAVRSLPFETLNTNPALERPFMVDIDMTDYKELRSRICKCGETKTAMCAEVCSRVACAVAETCCNVIKNVLDAKQIHCFYTGGRGIHIRVMDLQAQCMDDLKRAELTLLMKQCSASEIIAYEDAVSQRRSGGDKVNDEEELDIVEPAYINLISRKLIELQREFKIPLPIKIDEAVSTQVTKLSRGPFSIHNSTGKLYLPIRDIRKFNVNDYTLFVSELVKELIRGTNAKDSPDVVGRWFEAIELMMEWVTGGNEDDSGDYRTRDGSMRRKRRSKEVEDDNEVITTTSAAVANTNDDQVFQGNSDEMVI